MTNDDLQEPPICQLGMTFTEAISFRKVRIIFNYPFCFFEEPFIILYERICNDSQRMVSRLVCL